MKRKTIISIFFTLIIIICSTGSVFAEEQNMIYAYINEDVLTIKPAENSSASAFMDLLRTGDITVVMHDYGSFEKVGSIGAALPRNDEQITTQAGDIVLYSGNQIVLFYGSNSWSYTKLGKMGLSEEELTELLGNGDVSIVISVT